MRTLTSCSKVSPNCLLQQVAIRREVGASLTVSVGIPNLQVFKKSLSLVVESLSSVVLLGYPRPSLAGISLPWVLTGTHRCALMPRVASRQSANPFVAGVVLKTWSWTWSEMRCREHSVRCWNGENTNPTERFQPQSWVRYPHNESISDLAPNTRLSHGRTDQPEGSLVLS